MQKKWRTWVCLQASYNLFLRQYVCKLSVQVAKQDRTGLGIEKNSRDLECRDRRGLCGSETWGTFSERKRLHGILEG